MFVCFSIGYPVVTLGFGFKSYVGFRMRLRRQKEVEKENDYYYEFLREALPPGVREEVSCLFTCIFAYALSQPGLEKL